MTPVRQIDVFDNRTDKLIHEIRLEGFDLDLFKQRFGVATEDPYMYNSYEITTACADLFPNITFDFEKYAYYVACYQA